MFHLRFILIFSVLWSIGVRTIKVTRIPGSKVGHGEVPHWDEETRSLYYINIAGTNSTLNRYSYDQNRVYRATIDNAYELLFILPIQGTKDQFIVAIGQKVVIVKWNGILSKAFILRTLFKIYEKSSNYFNDAKIDFRGRFYGGTKCVESCNTNDKPTSAFYEYEMGKGVQKIFDNVFISNGLTWDEKTNKFHYVDSCTYDIKEFDYDPKTGGILNERQIFSLVKNGRKTDYILDGMTNDRDSCLYIAAYNGSKVIQFDPKTRQVLREIPIPAPHVTSLAFGGPKLDILFVTTGDDVPNEPEGAGYLYKIENLRSTGYPGVKLKLY